jgi:D-alanine-D-alanine ligase
VIIKPAREHASAGIGKNSVIYSGLENIPKTAGAIIKKYSQPAIVERFIEGREISVSLPQGGKYKAFPLSEIVFKNSSKICTYNAKWLPGSQDYLNTPPVCPAELDKGTNEKIILTAKKAAKCHLCESYARIDIRLDERMNPFVIDVNPNPDLGRASGFARSGEAAGISYEELVEMIAFTNQPNTK